MQRFIHRTDDVSNGDRVRWTGKAVTAAWASGRQDQIGAAQLAE
jgi:hypothetical protein